MMSSMPVRLRPIISYLRILTSKSDCLIAGKNRLSPSFLCANITERNAAHLSSQMGRLYKDFQAADAEILVILGDTPERARKYAEPPGAPFPVLIDHIRVN
jgi:hypothetical protein